MNPFCRYLFFAAFLAGCTARETNMAVSEDSVTAEPPVQNVAPESTTYSEPAEPEPVAVTLSGMEKETTWSAIDSIENMIAEGAIPSAAVELTSALLDVSDVETSDVFFATLITGAILLEDAFFTSEKDVPCYRLSFFQKTDAGNTLLSINDFEESVYPGGESTVEFSEYELAENKYAIAVTESTSTFNGSGGTNNNTVTFYALQNGSMMTIFSVETLVKDWSSSGDEESTHDDETRRSFIILSTKTNGLFDISVTEGGDEPSTTIYKWDGTQYVGDGE